MDVIFFSQKRNVRIRSKNGTSVVTEYHETDEKCFQKKLFRNENVLLASKYVHCWNGEQKYLFQTKYATLLKKENKLPRLVWILLHGNQW